MKYEIRNAAITIVIINIVIFALQIILGDNFTNSLALVSADIFSRPWILLTYMFVHNGPYHLFFNMYGLAIFGPLLEERIGSKRFLLIYLASGIFAAAVSSLFYEVALGASGAIMGMLGTLVVLMPDLKVLALFVVPMPLWLAEALFAIFDVLGVFFPSNIGHIAHLAGLGMGVLYGLYLKGKKSKFYDKFHSKKHLESDDIEEYLKTGRI